MADSAPRKVTQAPPWLLWLLTPLIARMVAREMMKKHPGLRAEQIVAKMRADLGPSPDAAGLRLLEAVGSRLPDARAAVAAVDGETFSWRSPSSLALIAANLLPLYGVFAWDWPVFPLLLLFWLENVVVGLLNVVRMLFADPGDAALWGAKLFVIPFFGFHYGMFTAVHGVFVIGLLGGKEYDRLVQGLWTLDAAARAIDDFSLWLPLAALAGSHLFSFFWNYLLQGEYRRAALGELMFKPYGRVVVLHVTILFGGWGAMLLGSPHWALLLLIGLKIGLDLRAHMTEHRQAAPGGTGPKPAAKA